MGNLWNVEIQREVIHALKMAFGALIEAYFGTRAATNAVVLQDGKLGAVRVHPKSRNGISPDTKHFFLEGRRHMHQTGIMGKNK